jgi:hypothetical protein
MALECIIPLVIKEKVMKYLMAIAAGALFCVSAHAESLVTVHGNTIRTSGNYVVINNRTVIVDGKVISGADDGYVTQGSGKIVTETRDIPNFHELVVDIAANVRVSGGNQARCSVKTDDNILPLISCDVKDGRLLISCQKSFTTKNPIEINLQAPGLARVVLKGSGNIALDRVAKEKISLEINGSGNISGKGKTSDIVASIDGSGNLRLGELRATNARIVLNGSGNARVSATDMLSGEINGSGDIVYSGSPRRVNRVIHGSGNINRALKD